MTRATWTEIAFALAEIRRKLEGHADRAKNENMRSAHLERVMGVDLATKVICRVLRTSSRRFNARRFMRLSRGAAK